VISAVGFGSVPVLAKLAFAHGADPASLLALRYVAAAALLWALVLRKGRPRPRRREVTAGIVLGVAVFGPQAGTFFLALERLDASLATLLAFTYPTLLIVADVLIRHAPLSRGRLVAGGVAALGLAAVVLGDASATFEPVGVALALTTAVLYATYLLVGEELGHRLDILALSAAVATGAAVEFVAWTAATGNLTFSGYEPNAVVLAVVLVVACTALPVHLQLIGANRLGASAAAIIATLEPVVALILAMLLLGELLTPLQALGALAVVGAAAAASATSEPRDPAGLARPPP
jgi:drug/metabolite transporter (DMT)-like permease